MGSYAHLYLGELMFDWAKNSANRGAVHLFRPEDKRDVDGPRMCLPRAAMRDYDNGPFVASRDLPAVYYETTARVLRERLDLMGYTMATAREYFEVAWERDEQEGLAMDRPPISPDDWMRGVRAVNEMPRPGSTMRSAPDDTSPIIRYMVAGPGSGCYGFPGYDLYAALRLAAETLNDDERLVYDLTDVASGGWVDGEEDLVEAGIEASLEEHAQLARTVVLTEGSSDSRAVLAAMKLLYPHVAGYFAFMDFRELKVAGGAGELAKLVKAFAGAGIANRIIALFDNDTGGAEAQRGLARLELPQRIALRALPPVELLERYPTTGSSGAAVEDVNGRAGSLELYFGRDVLAGPNGSLLPIRWGAYNSQVGASQGEVADKRGISKRFLQKLSRATAQGIVPPVDDPGWLEMRAVCEVLLTAFHNADARSIVERVRSS